MNLLQELSELLQKQPRVLMLGQCYLGSSPADNPLLAAFTALHPKKFLYDWWLEVGGDVGNRAAQVLQIDQTVSIEERFKRLLALPWTTVYTSAIDGLVRRHLEIPNRRMIQQVMVPGFNQISALPSLSLFRLFGSIERSAREELPPGNRLELFRHSNTTIAMLLPLLEIVTPSGYLFIEGWKPDRDWLTPRDLSTSLVHFTEGQVLLFGMADSDQQILESDRYFRQLLEYGIVRTFKESLADLITELGAADLLPVESLYEVSDTIFYPVLRARKVPKDGAPEKGGVEDVIFSRLEWRQLSQGVEIIIELDQVKPLPEIQEDKFNAFRNFIANGPQPDNRKWVSHFIFRRQVFHDALHQCLELCAQQQPQDHMVMVYGQSGSGKTSLLNLLAIELRKRGLPVILIERSVPPVNVGNLDLFCQRITEFSPLPIFLLYDGLQEPREYIHLSSYLASRGRKCIVVGTAFPLHISATTKKTKGKKRKQSGIHANIHEIFIDVRLSTNEWSELLEHLGQFIPEAATLTPLNYYEISNFFALIYRLLPWARENIEWGLVNEIIQESSRIQNEVNEAIAKGLDKNEASTLLGDRLKEALNNKMGDELKELFKKAIETSAGTTYELNEALLLINAVMLASQVNLAIPQSMALRLIRHSIPVYRGATSGDIIQDKQIGEGMIVLRSRLPLEAQIWVRQRLPQSSDQFNIIHKIVLTIQYNEVVEDTIELDFIVKLLQSIGPQGHEEFRMYTHFFNIVELIEELRGRYREIHPRLLLLGANAIREWVFGQQRIYSKETDPTLKSRMVVMWMDFLDRAENGLLIAFDTVRKKAGDRLWPAVRRILSTIETERASVLGAKIGTIRRIGVESLYENKAIIDEVDRTLKSARDSWRSSLQYDDNNYMGLDTACWILSERFQIGHLDVQNEAEYLADWIEVIDLYKEIDVPPSNYDKRDEREMVLYDYLGDLHRFQEVAERVMQRGSYAANVLTTRLIEQNESKMAARTYLEEHCAKGLFTDRRVLTYYMRLWWQTETGYESFFEHERLCLPFNRLQWEYLLKIANSRLRLAGEQDHGPSLFLQACSLVHLGRVEEARQTLDYLDRLGVGGFKRYRALLLLTDETGKPIQLSAEYQGRRRGRIYLAWCDALRSNVDFLPQEHGIMEPRPGIQVGPFHLSIRYRGLYADPTFRLGRPRKSDTHAA